MITCGMRLYDRATKSEMTCTHERGHKKNVHDQYLNGKWLGGWVDRAIGKVKGSDFEQRASLDMIDLPDPDEQLDLPSGSKAP